MNRLAKSLIMLFAAIAIMVAGTACSKETHPIQDHTQPASPLQVTYATTPASPVKANETIKIAVVVKHKEEVVKDANDVKFELWKSGQDHHEMIEAKHNASTGEYYIEHTFKEPGTYYIMYHVTARDQHSMQKKELVVQ